VVIEPFFADQVGPASIDLHLGDEIRGRSRFRQPEAQYGRPLRGTALRASSSQCVISLHRRAGD
jgi:hypothetical protein